MSAYFSIGDRVTMLYREYGSGGVDGTLREEGPATVVGVTDHEYVVTADDEPGVRYYRAAEFLRALAPEKLAPCLCCNGRGWAVFDTNRAPFLEVEACGECGAFVLDGVSRDDSATVAAAAWIEIALEKLDAIARGACIRPSEVAEELLALAPDEAECHRQSGAVSE